MLNVASTLIRQEYPETMEPVGKRIPIQISEEEVEKLASLHCTQEEIAAWFDMKLDAFETRLRRDKSLREAYDRGIGKGKVSLRRHQWKMVEEGNPTMAIWLGKQLLGQRDKTSLEVSQPASANQSDTLNLSLLTTQELQEYYRLRRKMDARAASAAGAGAADKARLASASEQVIDVTKVQ